MTFTFECPLFAIHASTRRYDIRSDSQVPAMLNVRFGRHWVWSTRKGLRDIRKAFA